MTSPTQRLFDQSLALCQSCRFLEAQQKLNELLSASPMEPEALGLMSLCLAKLGDFALAEETAHQALILAKNHRLSHDVLQLVTHEKSLARHSDYFRNYILTRSKYTQYPRSVSIETTGKCNAACSFCPHPVLERNNKQMSDQLFEKIITDLEDIPKTHDFTLFPCGVNEPFMDKKFVDRLSIVNDRLPQARIQLFTNMNVMHRDFSDRISRITNIDYFNVSFNAANRTEYEKVMQIDFDRTVANLKTLMKLNRSRKISRQPIILSRVADLTDSDQQFVPQVRALFSDFTEGIDYVAKVKNRTNWINRVDMPTSQVPSLQPCGAWFDINIYCTGIVPHCCQDSDGSFAIGNATKTHVLEIYNNLQFRYLREHITARGAAGYPCNQCSLLQ